MNAQWVSDATRAAMTAILGHADKVGLPNTEEFTFRSFFMAAAHELLGSPRFQTEWNKFDLLVQDGQAAVLIEFKYYLLRRTIGLDGKPGRPKGGAGLKNEREFYDCINKLRTAAVAGIHERRLVLVYERDDEGSLRRTRTLHRSYGQLTESSQIARVDVLSAGPLEARILHATPI